MAEKWFLLAYRLPSGPSRNRVALWRQLRKLGAVYLESGVWLLPQTESLANVLRKVLAKVSRNGGNAHLFTVEGISAQENEELKARFNEARSAEYDEIIEECSKFLAHFEREKNEGHYKFTEVEEMEEDLEKLERWLVQVKQRDVFGVPKRSVAEEELERCKNALAEFTQEAYERGGQRDDE